MLQILGYVAIWNDKSLLNRMFHVSVLYRTSPILVWLILYKNRELYTYDTGTSNHLPHVPILKFDSEKTGIRSRGVVVWNNILNGGIDADASETVFKKLLKSVINDEMIWSCINMPTKSHYTDNVDDNCYTSIYYIDV